MDFNLLPPTKEEEPDLSGLFGEIRPDFELLTKDKDGNPTLDDLVNKYFLENSRSYLQSNPKLSYRGDLLKEWDTLDLLQNEGPVDLVLESINSTLRSLQKRRRYLNKKRQELLKAKGNIPKLFKYKVRNRSIVSLFKINSKTVRFLRKGLSFVPSNPDKAIMCRELDIFKSQFINLINSDFVNFVKLGNCFPNKSRETVKRPFIRNLQKLMKQSPGTEPLSKCKIPELGKIIDNEFEKLKNSDLLAENDCLTEIPAISSNLVIKPSDKGSSVVVMRKDKYIAEGLRQLDDKASFLKLKGNMIDFHNLVSLEKVLLEKFFKRGNISYFTYKSLVDRTVSNPSLYFLPKIHKPLINGGFKGRPVVSGERGPLRGIDKVLEGTLNCLLCLLPNRVRDTKDFLIRIRDLKFDSQVSLVTLDVESLYPSIPLEEGIDILCQFYQSNRFCVEQYMSKLGLTAPSVDIIREALRLVLFNNIFTFNEVWYKQIKGTAIGSSISVVFAEIYVHIKLDGLFTNCPLVYFFSRFIDDIFVIWGGTRSEFNYFLNSINDASVLALSCEFHERVVHYLDVKISLIYHRGYVLETNVFTKANDLHMYLRYDSLHPWSIKNNIPFSQGLRYKRIISNPVNLSGELAKLMGYFIDRGYPKHVLNMALNKLARVDRETLLTGEKARGDNHTKFIGLRYHSKLSLVVKSFTRFINRFLNRNYGDYGFNSNYNVVWKRHTNIKKLVVKSY